MKAFQKKFTISGEKHNLCQVLMEKVGLQTKTGFNRKAETPPFSGL